MSDSKRSRGLLTDQDRDVIQRDWDQKRRSEKQPLYNLRSSVRNRVDELAIDVRLLEENEPDLADEIIPKLKNIAWADPETTYEADKNIKTQTAFVDDKELPPTRHIIKHGGHEKVEWGYRGTGPLQLATDMLIHATDVRIAERHSKAFMLDHTSKFDEAWEMTAGEIQQWVREMEQTDDALASE